MRLWNLAAIVALWCLAPASPGLAATIAPVDTELCVDAAAETSACAAEIGYRDEGDTIGALDAVFAWPSGSRMVLAPGSGTATIAGAAGDCADAHLSDFADDDDRHSICIDNFSSGNPFCYAVPVQPIGGG